MKTSLHLLILLLTLSMLGFAQPKSNLVGTIEHFENFQSKYVRPRNVDVWLPADYNKKEKYAVIYFQDGKMLFESVKAGKFEGFEWQVDETLTELVKQNKIRKTIVVAIWNTGEFRHSEYYPQKSLELLKSPKREKIVKELLADKPQADNYLLFMTKELKPYIDKKYSTAKDQKNTFLAGSSMGGLVSLYAISEYPKVFGGAACLSTHLMGATTPEDILDGFVPDSIREYFKKNLPSPNNHTIYFSYGNKGLPESYYKQYQTPLDELMKEKGYTDKTWISKEFDGGQHSPLSWAKQLPTVLEFLLRP